MKLWLEIAERIPITNDKHTTYIIGVYKEAIAKNGNLFKVNIIKKILVGINWVTGITQVWNGNKPNFRKIVK